MTATERAIPDKRLREIALSPATDHEDLAYTVCELAAALLERSQTLAPAASSAAPAPSAEGEHQRKPGKPLGDKLPHPCRNCGADVVTFISKRTSKPYQCDIEMGYHQNVRQFLTASNWLHVCPERKA